MPKKPPWLQSLRVKLGGSTLVVLLLTAFLVFNNIYTLRSLHSDLRSVAYVGQDRTAYEMLYLIERLASGDVANRAERTAQLRSAMATTEDRFEVLINGAVCAAADFTRCFFRRQPILNETRFGRCAAHVKRHHLGVPETLAERDGAHHARRRSRFDDVDRARHGAFGARNSAV